MKHILAIDQGTTGSRAFVFDGRGRIVASAYREFRQYYPKPGWVEHDADEIWDSCVKVVRQACAAAKIRPAAIAAIGITNQRETTVIWDRKTSKPVAPAIVWQCRRTAPLCDQLRKQGLAEDLHRRTGLVLDPYFSGTKVKWLLDNVPGLRRRTQEGRVAFGTIDSWLIWKLTGGRAHATDMTNASRTLLFNIRTRSWDGTILKRLGVPEAVLPTVQNSGSVFGKTAQGVAGLPSGIPIAGVMGDQQSALYGQGCFGPGTIKNTYGTGCFLMLNTGGRLIYSKKGLLTTLAADEYGRPIYALEGAVFIAGAVMQWLRDELRIIRTSAESEKFIKGLRDTQGVYFVPAFTGLGAPYWNAQARGLITGLTRGSGATHIVRSALESIAYQTKDVFDLMQTESAQPIRELKVDGGACRNDFLMQFQADLLDCRIVRPTVVESTAQGAAFLAGVTAGLWRGKKDLLKFLKAERIFRPRMKSSQRNSLYRGWQKAVQRTLVA